VAGFVEDQRTRANEAHFALEDIQQLRKFVQRSLAEASAEARHSRIVRNLEPPRIAAGLGVLVEMGNFTLVFVRIGGHGAELVDAEPLPMRSDPNLTEEDGPGRGRLRSSAKTANSGHSMTSRT
jgi:hypothetical protein